jgi:hypothetical protein
VKSHEERVEGDAVAKVVASATAFALEPEALVQPNRRLVPGKHVKLELADADRTGPADGRVEERSSDAPASMARRDHHPEVRDVDARRVRVPRQRETSDDPVAVERDENGRVGVPTHRLQVAALVGHGPPRLGGQEPALRLLPDRGRERDERRRVRALGVSDGDQGTTTP